MTRFHYFYGMFFLCLPINSDAFYQWQSDSEASAIELRGFARGVGLGANNPNDIFLFEQDEVIGAGFFGRLMLDIERDGLSAEMHLVQSVLGEELRTGGSRFAVLIDPERSDGLNWRYGQGKADLAIDRLNIQFDSNNLRLKLGRQPINLATTFYFTPNDFFAPFAAQAFFRNYKPGVDAARLDWQWSEYSQLSLMTVLDYETDLGQSTGWNTFPNWSQTAYLARASTLTDNFEFGLLTATVAGDGIIGFDFQGEIFDWFGLRGEGHLRFADEVYLDRDAQLSIAIDKRWQNTLSMRVEHFYQRSGATDSDDYRIEPRAGDGQFYLGRNYTALGVNYELSPLWFGDAVWLFSHQDTSKLLALYSTYSLSDESELAAGVNIPIGKQPEFGQLKTEFGSFPHSLTVEYRVYF
jgi:hypothetical protein